MDHRRVGPSLPSPWQLCGTASRLNDGFNARPPRSALSFYSESANKGISLPYPHITLHAISRDAAPPPSSLNGAGGGGESTSATTATACIYCQIEESEGELEDTEGMEESGTREMWITPSDPESGQSFVPKGIVPPFPSLSSFLSAGQELSRGKERFPGERIPPTHQKTFSLSQWKRSFQCCPTALPSTRPKPIPLPHS